MKFDTLLVMNISQGGYNSVNTFLFDFLIYEFDYVPGLPPMIPLSFNHLGLPKSLLGSSSVW